MKIYAKALCLVGNQKRTDMLHHFMISSHGRCLICSASKILQGSVEVITLNQAPFIEGPAHNIHAAIAILKTARE